MTSDRIAPPFIGFIETTYDALLIFEAARRGAIPRITRRLNDPEKPMIHSGAVFLFDEHESGIKRWTDGIVWSPSRILGNFLVYREVNNRANNRTTRRKGRNSKGSKSKSRSQSPNRIMQDLSIASGSAGNGLFDVSPPMGSGALQHRQDTVHPGLTRERERQLVGSLTSAYAFKPNGLIKRTISMNVGAFTQHLISYYLLDDVVNGRLRTPSTVPEFAAMDVSPDYLDKRHFRFPVLVEIGPDGIPRYKGEARDRRSPRAITNAPLYPEGYYVSESMVPSPPTEQASLVRRGPMPIPIPQGPTDTSYYTPGSAGSNGQAYFTPGSASSNGYWDQMSPTSQHSHVAGHAPGSRGTRPPSSSRSNRFDPMNGYHPMDQRRRATRAQHPESQVPHYNGNQASDIKPVQASNGQWYYPDYAYYGPTSGPANGAMPHSSSGVIATSPINGQFPATPFQEWQQLPVPSSHEIPRHGAGISPSVNHNAPLHPLVNGSSASAGSRPSTSQDNHVAYQANQPPTHQWHAPAAWDPNAPLAHPAGPGAYQSLTQGIQGSQASSQLPY